MKNRFSFFILLVFVIAMTATLASCEHICSEHEIIDERKDPTCSEKGLTEGSHCSICGEIIKEQIIIKELDHTPVKDEKVFPTCQKTGLTAGEHCSVCGEVLVAREEIPKVQCNYYWVYDIEPTKTEDGQRSFKCTMCGDVLQTEIVYAGSKGLTFEENEDGTYSLKSISIHNGDADIVIPRIYNGKAVTGICSGAIGTNFYSLTIPASITYIDPDAFRADYSSRSRVREFIVDENNTEFTAIDGHLYTKDGKVLLRYAGGKEDTSFTVPSGVEKIGKNSFANCMNLENVYISEGVETIEECAFYFCVKLKTISMPESLRTIEGGVFYTCENLKSVYFHNGVENVGGWIFQYCRGLESVHLPEGMTEIPDGLFWLCYGLKEVNIPDSVTKIGEQSFLSCSSLAEITLPDGLTYIGQNAFNGCASATEIRIPAGVTYIGGSAFGECVSVERFIVDEDNSIYTSVADCLCIKEGMMLMNYPLGKKDTAFTVPDEINYVLYRAFAKCEALEEVIIPNSVSYLGENIFYYCTNLKKVVIGNGITEIPDNTFESCYAIVEITMTNSVTKIGAYAISSCSSLEVINFNGTTEEWLTIEKEAHFDSYYQKYVIKCTDGTLDRNGELVPES